MDLFPYPKVKTKSYRQVEDNIDIWAEPFIVDHGVIINLTVMLFNDFKQFLL